jgi:hypothetical protein
VYSADTGEEFIDSFIKPGYVTAGERDVIRSVQALTDFMNLGYVRKKTFIPVVHPLDGEIGIQMQKLVHHLQSLRRSPITIKEYELYLNRFLTFLGHEQVYTVSGIKERHILKFVSTMENNKVNIVSYLRVLFRYWHEEKITDGNFHELLEGTSKNSLSIFQCRSPKNFEKFLSYSNGKYILKFYNQQEFLKRISLFIYLYVYLRYMFVHCILNSMANVGRFVIFFKIGGY